MRFAPAQSEPGSRKTLHFEPSILASTRITHIGPGVEIPNKDGTPRNAYRCICCGENFCREEKYVCDLFYLPYFVSTVAPILKIGSHVWPTNDKNSRVSTRASNRNEIPSHVSHRMQASSPSHTCYPIFLSFHMLKFGPKRWRSDVGFWRPNWIPSLLLAGGVACSQICMINRHVRGEHLRNQAIILIQRPAFSTSTLPPSALYCQA